MVAVLASIFGTHNLQLAEDVVQDALLRALNTWKINGIPDNPSAWLHTTAKNLAIDRLRRKKHSLSFDSEDPKLVLLLSEYSLRSYVEDFWSEEKIADEFLAMMFACCHPEIAASSQISFILKSLCGFSTKEVARAFVTSEDTISKRLYRTKEFFRKRQMRPQIPESSELEARTDTVLKAIYLIFNEGYSSTDHSSGIRKDIMEQALSLCKSLIEHERIHHAPALALMALMCFHYARTDSRVNNDGDLVLLSEQDRNSWDSELIELGKEYLRSSAFGEELSSYHIEAGIAHEHCAASSLEETNWAEIIRFYSLLVERSNDPIVRLNRAIALMQNTQHKEAIEELKGLQSIKSMEKVHLLDAALAESYFHFGDLVRAKQFWNAALVKCTSSSERKLLQEKLKSVEVRD